MYRGETCDECGLSVAFFTRSYWNAPDSLWNAVMGSEGNPCGEGIVVCPPCFTIAARAKGFPVHWLAVV